MAGADRRFGPSQREDPIDRPGLIIDDSNDTYVITADGVRHLLDGSGTPGPPGPAGGFNMPASAGLRYVGGVSGSDSNDGLSPSEAFATIQAAYNNLPAVGGTLVLLQAYHNVGTGFLGANDKPAVLMSLSGKRTRHDGDASPVIYGTGPQLFTVGLVTTGNIMQGWTFAGLHFDITNVNNTRAIQANDLNNLEVENSTCTGITSVEKYMVRSNYPFHDDASWYRLENNWMQKCGIVDLSSGEAAGNCNQHVISRNVIFPGDASWGMKLFNAQRCSIFANNIEGNGPGGVLFTGQTLYNYIFWNGGEGTISPYIDFPTNSSDNVYFNFGSAGTAVNVIDRSGNNYRQARAGFQYVLEKTDNYTLEGIYSSSPLMLGMNKATAIALTVPPNTDVPWGEGKGWSAMQKGAGQLTVTPGSGVILRSRNGLKTVGQWSVIHGTKIGANEWLIWGDTTP